MDASQMQELKERMLNASIDMLKDGGRVGIIECMSAAENGIRGAGGI